MNIKIIIISFIITYIFFSIIFIYIKEKQRIIQIVKLCNSPITDINITLNKTYIKNKKILYIKIFSPIDIILHEVAHSFCKSFGHTDEFNKIYFYLINKYSITLSR
jgi:hypothetical protein